MLPSFHSNHIEFEQLQGCGRSVDSNHRQIGRRKTQADLSMTLGQTTRRSGTEWCDGA